VTSVSTGETLVFFRTFQSFARLQLSARGQQPDDTRGKRTVDRPLVIVGEHEGLD
jgi:hypothetical protein